MWGIVTGMKFQRPVLSFLLCVHVLGSGATASFAQANISTAQNAASVELASVSPQAVSQSLKPVKRSAFHIPNARWSNKGEKRAWTAALVKSLRSHGSVLPKIVPRDIGEWCPAYPSSDIQQREAFWVGLVSSLAWHESTHRPAAVGGGGQWYGLVQIYPDTARRYDCVARSGQALKDPVDNLSCGIRIMARTVKRDQVVSRGMRGVAADWGPFHSRKKRTDMMAWTRKQDYCQGMGQSLRPVARPQISVTPVIPAQLDATVPRTGDPVEG